MFGGVPPLEAHWLCTIYPFFVFSLMYFYDKRKPDLHF